VLLRFRQESQAVFLSGVEAIDHVLVGRGRIIGHQHDIANFDLARLIQRGPA
jgi:hypothetical protein